jgi:hypothetical protein
MEIHKKVDQIRAALVPHCEASAAGDLQTRVVPETQYFAETFDVLTLADQWIQQIV